MYSLVRERPRPSGVPKGNDALCSLLGTAPDLSPAASLGADGGERRVKTKRIWLRGEVCPLVVDKVDLAPPGSTPVDVCEISDEG